MQEKQFNEMYLAQIKELLDFVLNNKYSDFYRKKYLGLGISADSINSYKDFQKIPFLTKDELLSIALEKRIFVPENEIYAFTASSGTTSSNRPLILPRTRDHILPATDKSSYYAPFLRLKVKRGMVLLPTFRAIRKISDSPIPMFPGDPQKLSLTAKIAKELSPDVIVTTPTLLTLFVDELKKVGFDLSQVKLIQLGSEFCSKQRMDYFQKIFTGAEINFAYGSSEVAGYIGYRCPDLAKEAPSIFHPHPRNVFELVDDKTGKPANDGEVVLTSLKLRGFPLIRYRTSDFAELLDDECPCGNPIIRVNGKRDLDILRFSGVTLHTQVIANSLPKLSSSGLPWFQMHVYERKQGTALIPELELLLSTDDISAYKGKEKEIATLVQKQLYLTATKTLDNLVEEGIFLPLKVQFIEKAPVEAKSKHIISHLE